MSLPKTEAEYRKKSPSPGKLLDEYAELQARLQTAKANKDKDYDEYRAAKEAMRFQNWFWRSIRELAESGHVIEEG